MPMRRVEDVWEWDIPFEYIYIVQCWQKKAGSPGSALRPPASPNRPSRCPRTGKLLRPQPNASCTACPDRTQPRQSLLRAAAAGSRCVLGTSPSPQASCCCRRRRVRGER